ncbi:hypothetical protein ZWY2020_020031 [Hordeum vulgare]|nr:hypothetical protein ZWY2020_020031 [Hordeum vulgare]
MLPHLRIAMSLQACCCHLQNIALCWTLFDSPTISNGAGSHLLTAVVDEPPSHVVRCSGGGESDSSRAAGGHHPPARISGLTPARSEGYDTAVAVPGGGEAEAEATEESRKGPSCDVRGFHPRRGAPRPGAVRAIKPSLAFPQQSETATPSSVHQTGTRASRYGTTRKTSEACVQQVP